MHLKTNLTISGPEGNQIAGHDKFAFIQALKTHGKGKTRHYVIKNSVINDELKNNHKHIHMLIFCGCKYSRNTMLNRLQAKWLMEPALISGFCIQLSE